MLNGTPQMCHGCLCADRNLQLITHNTGLYFVLLDDSTLLDRATFENILLCWECVALLRRIKCFQKRIKEAQQYLANQCYTSENILPDTKSLSCLKIVNNNDNIIIAKYNDRENEIKIEVEEKETVEEEEKENDDVDVKVKEENFDDFSSLIDDLHDTESFNTYEDGKIKEDTDNDKEYKPKVGYTSKSWKKKLRETKSLLDLSNLESYINEKIYTLSILQNLKKTKPVMYRKLHLKIRRKHSEINIKRSKDITKLAKKKEPCSCSYCGEDITLDTVNTHYEQHGIDTYECRLCYKTYNNHEDTSKHVSQKHKYVYICSECKEFFHYNEDFQKHLKQCLRVTCDSCKKVFMNKKKLIKHIRNMHVSQQCRICGRVLSSRGGLLLHLQRAHVPLSVPGLCYCVECDKYYRHADAYKVHLRNSVAHRPKRIYRIPCPECGKTFLKKSFMDNHYRLFHLKKTKHYCNICDKYYSNSDGLRGHILYVHEKADKPRTKICDLCGRAFHSRKILENHIRTHTGERPFSCPHCPAAFAQKTAMKSHVRTQHKYLK